MQNKYIKEEQTIINTTKNYITNLKNNIDTSEEQMNKEIENMIVKIKNKYANRLKDNKVQYFQLTNEYNTKKEELNAFINKGNVIKAQEKEEELEK